VGELAAMELLLSVLRRRGARAVLINLLPSARMQRFASCRDGTVGCTTRGHIERLDAALRALAANYSTPTIVMDHDGPSGQGLFNADLMHLNQAGHVRVHEQLMHLYATWPHWRSPSPPPSPSPSPSPSKAADSAAVMTAPREGAAAAAAAA